MKKHIQTKHVEQKCKTCDKVFPSTMEVVMHTASEHGKNIKEDQKDIKSVPQAQNGKEEELNFDIATKYKCISAFQYFTISALPAICSLFQPFNHLQPFPAIFSHLQPFQPFLAIIPSFYHSIIILYDLLPIQRARLSCQTSLISALRDNKNNQPNIESL